MAKWSGKIGFGATVETKPGIWKSEITEKPYRGELLDEFRRYDSPKNDSTNDEVNISNRLSIIADSYAFNHLAQIKYVELYGALWKVKSFQIQRPRLILTVGGVWNA